MCALLSDDTPNLDILRCVALSVVHDLAVRLNSHFICHDVYAAQEATVGDITPFDGVSKEEKTRRETVRFLSDLVTHLTSIAGSHEPFHDGAFACRL